MTDPTNTAAPAPTWVVMPVLGARDYTIPAIADVLAQTVPVRLLIINQGVEDAFREELERIAEAHEDRVFVWSHQPPLPSLAATWNRALDFVWACGGDRAWVVNNDARFLPGTVACLSEILTNTLALFVSCVGVTERQFDEARTHLGDGRIVIDDDRRGGPDFSCFLIAQECHEAFRFDEGFIPAYTEDLDLHRRIMLARQGHRIFSVDVPFLHYASGTLKSVDAKQRQQIEAAINAGSRAHYQRKWGGPVNQERFFAPFDAEDKTIKDGTIFEGLPNPPTTPALQEYFRGR
jgi:hypothetical protein